MGGLAQKRARVQKCRTQVKSFELSIEGYNSDNGEFPPGDGSNRSSSNLYVALYETGINQNSKVYMPELDPNGSDQFQGKIKNGLILDPFKHKEPYYYLRSVNSNGEQNGSGYNPDFDLWSLGPNGVGRGKGGGLDEEIDDDVTNWD